MGIQSISHYRILGELGRGGMGLVYKAEDTKLNRLVAIKVLSDNALVTEDDRSRFFREARAAAALHHPNIATVFEIGDYDKDGAGASPYIAMEYVDGQTLAEKIAKGPLPLEDVVSIGSDIAQALKTAHVKGVVHRDIKSANVMTTHDGAVKVLDFGLAKLSEHSLLTQQGTTLGTIAYMSPEQTRGKDVDPQSDIWSLGVVLYEMVAGRLPFQGDYSEATIYAILNADPTPLTALRTGVPMDLERIIFKCLAKDKKLRYQNVDEIPADLAAINFDLASTSHLSAYTTTTAPAFAQTGTTKLRRSRLATAVAGGLILTLVGVAVGWLAKPAPAPPPRPVTRFAIQLPSAQQVMPAADTYSSVAISRDGQNLVYVGGPRRQLYWLRLDRLQAKPIARVDEAVRPVFSPDGTRIAYYSNQGLGHKLYTTDLVGGIPILLTDQVSQNFRDAVWLPDDTIVFSDRDCDVSVIPARGGAVEKLLTRPEGDDCLAPLLTNGSDEYLFLRGLGRMYAVDLASKKMRRFGGLGFHYLSSGYFLSVDPASGYLQIAPLDLETVETTDRPVIFEEGGKDFGAVAFSNEGTLAVLKSSRRSELVWADRNGRMYPAASDFGSEVAGSPVFSPDGRRVAFAAGAPSTSRSVRILDRQTNRSVDLPGASNSPVWSPDGTRIFYLDCAVYPACIILGAPAMLAARPDTVFRKGWPSSLSSDGRYLAVNLWFSSTGESRIGLLDLRLDSLITGVDLPGSETGPRFSPDDKWISFANERDANWSLLVTSSSPDETAVYPVSDSLNSLSVWSARRPELYFVRNNRMMAATYEVVDGVFSVVKTEPLFRIEGAVSGRFDIEPGTERFLFERSDPTTPDSLLIVRNWTAEMDRLYRK